MEEHTTKRRKLGPPAALHKPFKSPLRGSAQPGALLSCPSSTADRTVQRAPAAPRDIPSSPPTATSQRFTFGVRVQLPPEITALQREHTALLASSRRLRTELDTIKQALKIEESDQDAELERLIQVWRTASRNAAEEIFATVRDRVNKMGGVYAWRKQEQDRKERLEEWARDGQEGEEESDEEEEEDNEYDEATSDPEERANQREARDMAREAKAVAREAREIAKAEAAEQQDDGKAVAKPAEEISEDEGFTMDMMLKEMKVDLYVIGFDASCQKWVD